MEAKKQITNQFIKRVWTALLCLLLMLTTVCPSASAGADSQEQKTVRIGYVNVPTYEEGGEGEYKWGAGYEYFQRISYVTGWKYEYVYGTFKECFDMLVSGDIDIFGNVSYTPERAKLIDFSTYPQGKDSYFLYMTRQNAELTKGDIRKLDHSSIGVTEGSYQEGLLKNWLLENKLHTQVVYCNGYDSLMAALDTGELDAIATPNLSTSYEYQPIVSIGFSDYYFGVSKSRPDLLKELNGALYEIQNTELDYNNLLVSRYQKTMSNNRMLNGKEAAWLDAHQNILKIGYLADNLPYSLQSEDGQMQGVMKALTDTLTAELGITVQTKAYDTSIQLSTALEQGDVDAIGPIYSDFYLAEQKDHVLTNSFLTVSPVLIFKDPNQAARCEVIAVSNENLFSEDVVRVLYPEAEQYLCGGIQDSLDAVASGKAASTLVASMRLNVLRQYHAMDELQFADTSLQAGICLATTKAERVAASILNKAISLSSNMFDGVVLAESSYVESQVSLEDFVKAHMAAVFGGIGLLFLILSLLTHRLFVNGKKLSAALETAKKEKEYAYRLYLNNSELEVKANQDALTKIGNRHSFTEKISELLASPEGFVLCYCDLDNLKYINDKYGHTEGDHYIRTFVEVVKSQIRSGDTFARIGGDEFCILLKNCTYDTAAGKVQRIQNLFRGACTGDYPESFSCGIIEVPKNHGKIEVMELLQQADALMYQQKKEHKNVAQI